MSRSHNHVTLLGNTGSTPETIDNGIAFSLATTEEWTDDKGTERSRTDWHRCVMFGARAAGIAPHIKKGQRLHIVGRLRSSSYTDAQGVKRRGVDVAVSDVIFCDGPRRAQEGAPEGRDMPGEG